MSTSVLEFIDNLGIQILEGYGLTETSPLATMNVPGGRKYGTVGRAIPDVDVRIVEGGQRILPPTDEGEICISGPNVMIGYHNKPEATAEAICTLNGKRFFRTGDLGRFDSEGFLRITGRLKEQFKLENGKFVVPAPVEDAINLSRFIAQVYVYGANKPYCVALVVPDWAGLREWAALNGLDATADASSLLSSKRVQELINAEVEMYSKTLRSYEVPRKWRVISEAFSPQNDLLTPKLSLKRHNIYNRYARVLEAMFDPHVANGGAFDKK